MTSNGYISEFIAYLAEIKKSSNNTVSAYERDLCAFSAFISGDSLDILNVTSEKILSYKKSLSRKGFSPSSVSRAMSSLRGFYKYLYVKGVINENPSKTIKNDKVVKKNFEILTSKEIDLLLSQPDLTCIKGIRDKAMLEVMYATGIKVSEIISLDLKDINLQLGFIYCKGDKSQKHERTIFLYPAALKCLKEYIENSRKFLSDNNDEALFLNINGSRMTRQGFWKILKGYVENAGIKKTITPHTLRHSFATHLLENGADINDIKEILGHSDIASTQVYTNYLKSKMKDSFLKFHPRA